MENRSGKWRRRLWYPAKEGSTDEVDQGSPWNPHMISIHHPATHMAAAAAAAVHFQYSIPPVGTTQKAKKQKPMPIRHNCAN